MFKKRIKLGSLNSGNMLTKIEFTGFVGFFFGDGMGMFPLHFFETLYMGMAKANF